MHSATGDALFLGAINEEMVCNFGFKVIRTCTLEIIKVFRVEIVHQKVKKHPNSDLSSTFWTHISNLGIIKCWGVKWTSNAEIPSVFESILEEISNELSLAQFRFQEGLHKGPKIGIVCWANGAARRENFAQDGYFSSFSLCAWILSHGGWFTFVNDEFSCNYDR